MSVAFNYINKNDKLMICVLALEIGGMLTFEQKKHYLLTFSFLLVLRFLV